jgi:molybdopterin-guanine dinucleotide biosynthesis protein B
MIPTVSFIGHHDSGKTRLLSRLIPLLVARGLRVGSVKLSPHLEHVDRERTDSAMHFASGALRTLLRGETESALFWRHGAESIRGELDRIFVDCDLVLVEGGKRGPFPKIEVFRRAGDLRREPLAGEIDVAAVVTDERIALSDDIDVLPPHALEAIADLVEALAFSAQGDDSAAPETAEPH